MRLHKGIRCSPSPAPSPPRTTEQGLRLRLHPHLSTQGTDAAPAPFHTSAATFPTHFRRRQILPVAGVPFLTHARGNRPSCLRTGVIIEEGKSGLPCSQTFRLSVVQLGGLFLVKASLYFYAGKLEWRNQWFDAGNTMLFQSLNVIKRQYIILSNILYEYQ